jgi:MoxR-like ATPase
MNPEMRNAPEIKLNPMVTEETHIEILGTKLEKGSGGDLVPKAEQFKNQSLTEFDYLLMRDIAVSLALNQPVLLQGGSGIGKSQIVDRIGYHSNKNVYSVNCHNIELDALIGKNTTDEKSKSGFGWKDGFATQAIRKGGILFLDEFNFMRDEVRSGLHQLLDNPLRGKEEVLLLDNNGEVVKVHPDFRLIVAQNPPGGKNTGRYTLDAAQYTRFVNINLPEDLPRETKKARSLSLLGKHKETQIPDSEYLEQGNGLTMKEVGAITGIEDIINNFIQFHEQLQTETTNEELGADESQPVHFSYQRDYNRMMQFISKFYRGDINDTLQKALQFYFVNRFISENDRNKVKEIMQHVGFTPLKTSQRIGLNTDATETHPDESPIEEKSEKEKFDEEKLKLYTKEQILWDRILGKKLEIKPLPDSITPEVKKNLEGLGLELCYIPKIDLPDQDTFKKKNKKSVDNYLQKLLEMYPNWKNAFRSEKMFWEEIKNGKIKFPVLPGQWMAVETVEKPHMGNEYVQTALAEKLGFENRFSLTWDEITFAINSHKNQILKDVGLSVDSSDIRLLEAIEWDFLRLHEKDWGINNSTYEFTNTSLDDEKYGPVPIIIGNPQRAYIYTTKPNWSGKDIGFRVGISLKK